MKELAKGLTSRATQWSAFYGIPLPEAEVKFLRYRLEVVQSWPDSTRKQATIEGILQRLGRAAQ